MKLENELREVMRAATAVLDGSRGISKDVLAVNADRMRWLEEAVRNAQIADADSAGEKHVATD